MFYQSFCGYGRIHLQQRIDDAEQCRLLIKDLQGQIQLAYAAEIQDQEVLQQDYIRRVLQLRKVNCSSMCFRLVFLGIVLLCIVLFPCTGSHILLEGARRSCVLLFVGASVLLQPAGGSDHRRSQTHCLIGAEVSIMNIGPAASFTGF